jgi:hypothetical protein
MELIDGKGIKKQCRVNTLWGQPVTFPAGKAK